MHYFSWRGPRFNTRVLTLAALLIALELVLAKISFGPSNLMEIGLGFIGTVLIGYYLGPWWGAVALVICDIIGHTILATSANFFVGFTIGAGISGLISGLFLYRQKITALRVFLYELTQVIISNLIINTLNLHIMYKTPIMALLVPRVPKEIITLVLNFIVGWIVLQAVSRFNLHDRFRLN